MSGGGYEYFADINNNESLRNEVNVNSGQYDGFIWISNETGSYSPTDLGDIYFNYVKKRIKHYQEDPRLLVDFFATKLLVQWTEPTFQSIATSNWCKGDDGEGYRMCERDYTVIAEKIYYGKLNQFILFVMDTVQTIIPLGLFVALFKMRKKIHIQQMVPLICLLGGAFLYIFWESKTQYNLIFYLMMMPYSGLGWSYLLEPLNTRIAKLVDKIKMRK